MEEIKKILKRYLFIITLLLVIMGMLINKEHIASLLSFWSKLLTPFFIGIFIAYLLNPIEIKIEKLFNFKKEKLNKIFSIIITYILFIGILSGFSYLCFPQIMDSITQLINQAPSLYNNCLKFLEKYEFLNAYEDTINNLINTLTESLTTFLPNLLNWITTCVKSIFNIIISIVLSIYFLLDKESIKNNLYRLGLAYLKEEKTNKIKHLLIECNNILNKFIIAKSIDSLIIGILCAICMYIFKLDYIAFISLFFGVTNMIPYFGPIIGVVVGVLILLIVDFKSAITFLIIGFLLQQLDPYVIQPKVIGSTLEIKPIWIIFSVLIGGALFGIVGMFLGTPIIAIILYIIERDINKRLEYKKIE